MQVRSEDQRSVDVCLSTMSGCPMGCRFCGAGEFFVRNLSAAEIVSQAQFVLNSSITPIEVQQISNLRIRAMRMGEPLLNRALWPALQGLHAMYPLAALWVSTSAPDMDWAWVFDMGREISTVELQFSVHESTDATRNKRMPFKRKLNLAQIAEKGRAWYQTTGRRPSFNYCVHDANGSQEDALNVGALYDCSIWDACVSLIFERKPCEPDDGQQRLAWACDFSKKLAQLGFHVHTTDTTGAERDGSDCGQLWAVQEWVAQHPALARVSAGYRHSARLHAQGFNTDKVLREGLGDQVMCESAPLILATGSPGAPPNV